MKVEYSDIARYFGVPVAIGHTDDHVLVVADAVDRVRVARLNRIDVCDDCDKACEELGRVDLLDVYDAATYVADAECVLVGDAREAFDHLLTEGWIKHGSQEYRAMWIQLAAHDMGVSREEAAHTFDAVNRVLDGAEVPVEEGVRLNAAYAGDTGGILITGTREQIERIEARLN
jgi:hypothetical protein